MNDLIKSYLIHYGYIETLQAIEEVDNPKEETKNPHQQDGLEDAQMTDENQNNEVRKQTDDQLLLASSLNFEGLRPERLSSIDDGNNNFEVP